MEYDRPAPAANPLSAVTTEERDRVVLALCAHFAADHLEMDELDGRLSLAWRAQSMGELRSLVADLPAISADESGAGPRALLAPSEIVPERGVVMAVMGGVERKGGWLVPRLLKVFCFMGGAELDLREARFAPGVTEIDILTVWGGVEIMVPPGVRVETVGAAFMGGFGADAGDVDTLDPGQPVLRVSGVAIMAGVEVKRRKPGKKTLARFETALKAARQLVGGVTTQG